MSTAATTTAAPEAEVKSEATTPKKPLPPKFKVTVTVSVADETNEPVGSFVSTKVLDLPLANPRPQVVMSDVASVIKDLSQECFVELGEGLTSAFWTHDQIRQATLEKMLEVMRDIARCR
jgi:hypothetical protein